MPGAVPRDVQQPATHVNHNAVVCTWLSSTLMAPKILIYRSGCSALCSSTVRRSSAAGSAVGSVLMWLLAVLGVHSDGMARAAMSSKEQFTGNEARGMCPNNEEDVCELLSGVHCLHALPHE